MLLQVVTTTWVSFPRCQSCWCLVEKHKVSNGIPAVMHSVAILGQNRERSHSQLIMYSMGACKGRPCFNLNSLQCLKNKQEVKATARTIRRAKQKVQSTKLPNRTWPAGWQRHCDLFMRCFLKEDSYLSASSATAASASRQLHQRTPCVFLCDRSGIWQNSIVWWARKTMCYNISTVAFWVNTVF